MRRIGSSLGVASSVLLLTTIVGCSAQSEEPLDDVQQSLVLRAIEVRRVFNSTVFQQYRALDSQNALPSGALVDPVLRPRLVALGGGSLERSERVDALASSEEGATLLRYAIRCALRGDESLREFDGRLGLAPNWKVRALTQSEQRWLSACLMAHTNNLGHVDIAVSGPAGSLVSGVATLPLPVFSVEEAAFYGNVFTQGAPEMFACSGIGTQQLCSDRGVGADITRRICGSAGGECGFKFMGPCNKLAGSTAASGACPVVMPYRECVTSSGARLREVITTNLRTDVALLGLQPSCGQQTEPACPASHHVCSMGEPLGSACSEGVCSNDPYCCTTAWDSTCVEAARAAGKCL